MSNAVLLETRQHVAVITLNRPEQANVLDAETSTGFIEAVASVAADPSLRAVLLRGSGRYFCAGGDIRRFVAAETELAQSLDERIPLLNKAILTLATLPIPVVSELNGPIGGGGIGLALCADIVLAAESMKLRGGYSAIGLTPDVGVSWFLTRLVGPMLAKRILFTNESMTARQCLDAGIVAQVFPDHELEAAAWTLVESLSRSATGSLGRIKSLVNDATQHSLSEQLAREHRCMVESGATADAREGVRAFMEKRAAQFGQSD